MCLGLFLFPLLWSTGEDGKLYVPTLGNFERTCVKIRNEKSLRFHPQYCWLAGWQNGQKDRQRNDGWLYRAILLLLRFYVKCLLKAHVWNAWSPAHSAVGKWWDFRRHGLPGGSLVTGVWPWEKFMTPLSWSLPPSCRWAALLCYRSAGHRVTNHTLYGQTPSANTNPSWPEAGCLGLVCQ